MSQFPQQIQNISFFARRVQPGIFFQERIFCQGKALQAEAFPAFD
jgi:hypothetical protein